ncbi:MAG: GSCFA domain-containing protein [Paludibacteraceae bacterium]|nr:GSCFA domain-containing protein [Paludibacteraceae bacterium]
MKFTTPVNIKPNKTIDHNSRIVMLGSCFAENIGKKLIDCGFNVVMNPMGILYNPISIFSALERIVEGREFTEDELFCHNGLWTSFMHHGSFSHADKNEALKMMNERLKEGHEQLKDATHLIITFGSAEVYEHDGKVVSNCHKLPAREFTHRLLSINEINNLYKSFVIETQNIASLQTIFTVSPVRYLGNGAHHGQINKATLLLATNEICKKTGADYFPSYEIMMDELRDYRYYAEDMIHPSDVAINYIFEQFTETYLTDEAIRTADEIQKIKKSLAHRPLHPDSEEYQNFKKKLSQQIAAIVEKYPNVKIITQSC